MGVVGPDDWPLTDTEYEGIQARTVIDPDTGAGAITLGELVLEPGAALPLNQPVRLRLTARHASVYSVYVTEPGETPVYHQFEALLP